MFHPKNQGPSKLKVWFGSKPLCSGSKLSSSKGPSPMDRVFRCIPYTQLFTLCPPVESVSEPWDHRTDHRTGGRARNETSHPNANGTVQTTVASAGSRGIVIAIGDAIRGDMSKT